MAENQLASQIENSSTTITLHNDEADGNAQVRNYKFKYNLILCRGHVQQVRGLIICV